MQDRGRVKLKPSWWTKERVLLGLQRFHQEMGDAPTGRMAYGRLVRASEGGRQGAHRRYPSEYAILRHWPSMGEAWRAAGIEVYGEREEGFGQRRREWVDAQTGQRWIRPRQIGERHGRLVVVELAGYRERERDRVALWRCRCDCGGERLVEAGRLKWKRECERCARERMLGCIKPGAEAARRAAQVQASVLTSSSSLAGAAGAPRATSPGKPAERGGLEPLPALFTSSTQEQV